MKKITFMTLFVFYAAAVLFAAGKSDDTAKPYPVQDIQFIVPFPVGGATGSIAQSLVHFLDKEYSVNVVLNSITGAGGSVGARHVLNSKADGYTYLIIPPGLSVQKALTNLDFTFRDFTPVAAFASAEQILVVRKDSKYKTFDDFINDARANPSKVKFGVPMGTSLFMGVLAMQKELNVKFNIIDIGGVSVKAPELLSGRVDAFFDSAGKTIPYINSNDFRAIGVWSNEPSEFLTGVPDLKKYGFNTILEEVIGIWAPKDIPQEAVFSMRNTVKKITEDEQFKEEFKKITTKVRFMDTKDYIQFLGEYEKNCIMLAPSMK